MSDWLKMFDKKEPSDPIQTVRESIALPYVAEAFDRIEAVVKAARAVQHGANIRVLYRALAALDSQEKGA